MSMPVTIAVPVNAQLCIQTAYETLLTEENLNNSPYIDSVLLFTTATVDDTAEFLITVKKINENETEMTIDFGRRLSARYINPGKEIRKVSEFLKRFSLALQNKTS